jgi:hypothetical protein
MIAITSQRTLLILPTGEEALKALFDVFVDNDDRTRLHVWVNRDYGPLRALVGRRRGLVHQLEKEVMVLRDESRSCCAPERFVTLWERSIVGELADTSQELAILRKVNKQYLKSGRLESK